MVNCENCGKCGSAKKKITDFKRVVALAGNSNVGKSSIFNQLTGMDQIIGNWPGKTVERAEGLVQNKGLIGPKIKIVDLPGIYSFSTYSMEEIVSREFIALEKPDLVVNVIDASALERNLFLTLQLIELGVPIVIALNQVDLMKKKGLSVNAKRLEEILGVPVVVTVATKGKGIKELIDNIINVIENKKLPNKIKYGLEVEQPIEKLIEVLKNVNIGYPVRWTAIKLIEKDAEILKLIERADPNIPLLAGSLADEIEHIHGETSGVIITGERYQVADSIANEVVKDLMPAMKTRTLTETLDSVALHPILGYLTAFIVIGGLLVWTFLIGAYVSTLIQNFLTAIEQYEPVVTGPIGNIIWNGAFTDL
jgi:ferrous iron transport protein B